VNDAINIEAQAEYENEETIEGKSKRTEIEQLILVRVVLCQLPVEQSGEDERDSRRPRGPDKRQHHLKIIYEICDRKATGNHCCR